MYSSLKRHDTSIPFRVLISINTLETRSSVREEEERENVRLEERNVPAGPGRREGADAYRGGVHVRGESALPLSPI